MAGIKEDDDGIYGIKSNLSKQGGKSKGEGYDIIENMAATLIQLYNRESLECE